MSKLVQAARAGDITKIRNLLQNNRAHIDDTEKGTKLTALHAAAANKNEATTYVLLTESKANPHTKDAKGRRPIEIAVETGNKTNIQMLREATHAKTMLSLGQSAKSDASTILPQSAINFHADRANGKGQGR